MWNIQHMAQVHTTHSAFSEDKPSSFDLGKIHSPFLFGQYTTLGEMQGLETNLHAHPAT